MAASIKGLTTLVFGADSVTTVIMQNIDVTTTGEYVAARDEDGDTVALAFYGSNTSEVSGEYIYKGAAIGTIAAAVAGITVPGTGSVFLISYGTRKTNTGFMTGNFRAVSVDGITA